MTKEYTRDDVEQIVEDWFDRNDTDHGHMTYQEDFDGFVDWLMHEYDLPGKLTEDEQFQLSRISTMYYQYRLDDLEAMHELTPEEIAEFAEADITEFVIADQPDIEELPGIIADRWQGAALPFMLVDAYDDEVLVTSHAQIAADFVARECYDNFRELDSDYFDKAWDRYAGAIETRSLHDYFTDPANKDYLFSLLQCQNGDLDAEEDLFYFLPESDDNPTDDEMALFSYDATPFEFYADAVAPRIAAGVTDLADVAAFQVYRLPSRDEVLAVFERAPYIRSMWSEFPYCIANDIISLVAPQTIRDAEDLMTYVACDLMGSFTRQLIHECREPNPAEFVAYELVSVLERYNPKKMQLIALDGGGVSGGLFARMMASHGSKYFQYIQPERSKSKDARKSGEFKIKTGASKNKRKKPKETIWSKMMGR